MDQQEMPTSKPMLERFGGLALTVFAFLLPVFVVPVASLPFQAGKVMLIMLFAFVLLVVWLISRLKIGSVHIPWTSLLAIPVVISVLYFISAALSASPMQGLVGRGLELDTALSILSLVVLLFLGSQLLRSKQAIFNLYMALFGSFFVVFLFGLIRLMTGPGFLSLGVLNSAVSNLIGSWNDLGVFYGLITILSIVMLEIVPPKGALRWILYVALALSVLSLMLVNFTTLWYVVGVFTLGLCLYTYAFSRAFRVNDMGAEPMRKQSRVPVIPLVVAIVAFIFALTGSQFVSGNHPGLNIGNKISQSFNISQLEARPSWTTTMQVAGGTLKTKPLLGAGPNQFVQEWLKYRPQVVNQSAFWNVDFNFGIGIIPSTLVSVGIIGLIAWLAFLGLFVYQGSRALRRPREDLFAYYVSVTAFAASLYLWVMAIFYTTSIVPFALAFLLTGVFIASLTLQGGLKEKVISFAGEPSIRFVALLVTIVLVAGSIISVFVVGERDIALAYFNQALSSYSANGDLAKAETNVRKAISISGEDLFYRGLSEIALINLNKVASQITAQTPPDQIRNQFQVLLGGAIQSAQAARDANPTDYQNWISLGRTYESVVPIKINGAYDSAKSAYLEAQKRNPTSPLIPLMLAQLEVENGSNANAKTYVTQALNLKNNYTDAIYLLSQIQVAEGDLKSAIDSVQSAAVITPNDPTVYFQLGFLEYNNKDYAKAAQALEAAVQLQNQYANARYFLGLSYDKLGRKQDALNQFLEIQKTNPDNGEVKGIIANLQAGKDAFANVKPPLDNTPEKRKTPPIPETQKSTENL